MTSTWVLRSPVFLQLRGRGRVLTAQIKGPWSQDTWVFPQLCEGSGVLWVQDAMGA